MRLHTKNYFDFFDIDYDIPTGYHDYIDCEVCSKNAIDLHHIKFKSQGGTDNVTNIIALCRECHEKAHAKIFSESDLQVIHNLKISEKVL